MKVARPVRRAGRGNEPGVIPTPRPGPTPTSSVRISARRSARSSSGETRMVRLLHLLQRDGEALHDALKARMADLPAVLLRSITWDQGAEMARHLTITQSLGAPVYFCDSRSPWQRGSNENTSGLLRDYFPQRHRFEHPFDAEAPGRRERAQPPAKAHPQRPRASRAVRAIASP